MIPVMDPNAAPAPCLAFLFDLIQDINVLRPLVRVLAHETRLKIYLLVSHKLKRRDRTGAWVAELTELARLSGGRVIQFDSPLAVQRALSCQSGVLFSASETDLAAHEVNHDVFRAAPNGFVRITVQHGHECVGFRQNYEQTVVHGREVRFAADIVCGWAPIEAMEHLCRSERPKFFELGPPAVLNKLFDVPRNEGPPSMGLVCENLHSVRMRTTGEFQETYIETLQKFAATQAEAGRSIALRPHPGGQFVLRNNIPLPRNVQLANYAMYKTDLARFAYGISAPSSVLIDMVMAGIPTAVWRDADSIIDTSGYEGLTIVSCVADWAAFAEAAFADPGPIIARQQAFLARNNLDIAPEVVRDRLLALVESVLGDKCAASVRRTAKRVLLVANGVSPTLHISFIKPLEALVAAGLIETRILTETEIQGKLVKSGQDDAGAASANAIEVIDRFAPDLAVFCRYSGPAAREMVSHLRQAGAPVIFHIDDDLLNVPPDIGPKHVEHNKVERTSVVQFLLEQADLIYCSTTRLSDRLQALGFTKRLSPGSIYCTGDIVRPASRAPVLTIGFMGNDKTPELLDIVPAITQVLDQNPTVRFELFGSMSMPEELSRFGNRVNAIARVSNYDEFTEKFHALQWDVGLAPLRKTAFNSVKADTKWVDYTSIGAAVIASRGTAYDSSCADGCGILVDRPEDWSEAIQLLVDDFDFRYHQIVNAQQKLLSKYSIKQLTDQVLDKFDSAYGATFEDRAPRGGATGC
jgi:glycosyltransferase involved in cell wall biosynthesis